MPVKVTRPPPKPKAPRKPSFPIRKPALVKAGDAVVQPINTGKVKAHYVGAAGFHGWIWAQYAAVAVLLLTAIAAGLWVRKTLLLAEVGEVTCSADNHLMWLQETPDSRVPELNDAIMSRCAKAYNPF